MSGAVLLGETSGQVSITRGRNINQVTAEKIEGSFNRAQTADGPSDEIKTLLQELANQVTLIAEKLSEKDQGKVSRSLATVTDEAISATPDAEYWDVDANRIIKAAESVGTVGLNAVSLIAKLRVLLPF